MELKKQWTALVLRALRVIALVYVGLCVLLYFEQRQLLYFPQKADAAEMDRIASETGFGRWKTREGKAIGWRTLKPVSEASPRLLVFHGNGQNALNYVYFQTLCEGLEPFPEMFVLEYPGYGDRPGSPSQDSILAAAREAVEELLATSPRPLYLFGQSLGTGAACAMAAEFRESIPGILLMTPHAGLAEVAADHYPFFPVRWMVKDPFPSKEWLRTYVGREVMVVCLEDEVIPPRFGRELFEYAVGPKTLIEIPDCGHNTWPLHRGAEWFAQAWNFLCQSKASNHGPHFPSLKN